MEIEDLEIKLKIWLEYEGDQILGPGLYRLLLKIKETGSLKQAALSCEYSYKYAWSKIKKVQERTGKDLVIGIKGGTGGGGSMLLTPFAKTLMEIYEKQMNSLKKFEESLSKQQQQN